MTGYADQLINDIENNNISTIFIYIYMLFII